MFATLALASTVVLAHHASTTEFDVSRLILLHGRINTVEWVNPHVWLHLEVSAPGGQVTTWRIEGASPNLYSRRKFPKDRLIAGLEIAITAYPARSGEPMADGATITFPDGTRFFFGGSAPIDGLDPQGKPCIRHSSNPGCR